MKGKELQAFSFLGSLLPIHKFKRPRSRSGTVFERSKSQMHAWEQVQPYFASRGRGPAAWFALFSSMCAAGSAHRLCRDWRSQPRRAAKGHITAGHKAVKWIYKPGPKTGHAILIIDYTDVYIAVLQIVPLLHRLYKFYMSYRFKIFL